MSYTGGVSKNELEIRIKRLQAEINRLLAAKVEPAARQVAVQIAAEALESIYWNNILSKPSVFPPEPHTHTESDITDLDKYTQAQVDALVGTGSGLNLEDLNGGIATSFYIGLLADGGNAAEAAFTGGIVDPGGA